MEEINLSKDEILKRISYFKNKNNISAYQIGTKLGHSKNYFYRIESGEIQLTLESFLEILEILKVTTSEFFCPTYKNDDKALFNMIKNLSNESKQSIIEIIKRIKN